MGRILVKVALLIFLIVLLGWFLKRSTKEVLISKGVTIVNTDITLETFLPLLGSWEGDYGDYHVHLKWMETKKGYQGAETWVSGDDTTVITFNLLSTQEFIFLTRSASHIKLQLFDVTDSAEDRIVFNCKHNKPPLLIRYNFTSDSTLTLEEPHPVETDLDESVVIYLVAE